MLPPSLIPGVPHSLFYYYYSLIWDMSIWIITKDFLGVDVSNNFCFGGFQLLRFCFVHAATIKITSWWFMYFPYILIWMLRFQIILYYSRYLFLEYIVTGVNTLFPWKHVFYNSFFVSMQDELEENWVCKVINWAFTD